MHRKTAKHTLRRFVFYGLAFLLGIFIFLVVIAERFIVPVLKERLETLIVEGSDSLYTYRLGDLKASFLGSRIQVTDLDISIDSSRYHYLQARRELPSLTLQL